MLHRITIVMDGFIISPTDGRRRKHENYSAQCEVCVTKDDVTAIFVQT